MTTSSSSSTVLRSVRRRPRWLAAAILASCSVLVAPGCGGGGGTEDPVPPGTGGASGQAGAAGGGVGGGAGALPDGGQGGTSNGGSAGNAQGGSAGNAQGGSAGTAGSDAGTPCTSDGFCAGNPAGSYCDLASGKCVQCKADDPTTCQAGLYCDAATLTCLAGCDTQDDCNAAADAGVMHCDLSTHKCVGCTADDHCALGMICKAGSCDEGCTAQHGCEAGLTCCSGSCVNTDSDADHCGTCGAPCKIQNGMGHCGGGVCSLDACDSPFEDCDKIVANGCELDASQTACECAPGEIVACFNGLPEWNGVGACKPGSMTCNSAGTGWSNCVGEVLPVAESCSTPVDDDCDGLVNEDGLGCLCVPNTVSPCYTGAPATRGVGACSDGTWTCNDQGTAFGACTGEVLPANETCATPVDDDCDGEVNEAGGAGCACAPNSQQPCYTGPAGTAGVGPCVQGVQTCDALGQGYGACTGDVVPVADVCTDNIDNDCNGVVNDGFNGGAAGCVCVPGATKACYTGAVGTLNVGACKAGISTCTASGDAWGPCDGEVVPTPDHCTDNLDNDCNGVLNDGFGLGGTGCVCVPATQQICYDGPPGTQGIGVCKAGKRTCSDDGSLWGDCFGQIIPDLDSCLDAFDNDCNGVLNDGNHLAPGCACIPGQMKCVADHEVYCDANGDWGPPQGLCNQICKAGQFSCEGNQVMECFVGPPAKWVPRVGAAYVCSASAHTKCDATTGTCKTVTQTGDATSTGVYYQYATFTSSNSVFKGGYDVDTYGDLIYVNRSSAYLDIYRVTLLDSDGDGKLEPNQHPDNPLDLGPKEGRTLTLVKTLTKSADLVPLGSASQAELYITNDRVFSLGPTRNGDITEYNLLTKTNTLVVDSTASFALSMMGYAEQEGIWYGGREDSSLRYVYSFHQPSKSWVSEFAFPSLGGGHFDGIEAIVAPSTGVQYVYVSDMTSDYIGQYRRDGVGGWVKENIFRYNDATGSSVEGMGFGALNHLWATGGSTLYELGGGDLSTYLE